MGERLPVGGSIASGGSAALTPRAAVSRARALLPRLCAAGRQVVAIRVPVHEAAELFGRGTGLRGDVALLRAVQVILLLAGPEFIQSRRGSVDGRVVVPGHPGVHVLRAARPPDSHDQDCQPRSGCSHALPICVRSRRRPATGALMLGPPTAQGPQGIPGQVLLPDDSDGSTTGPCGAWRLGWAGTGQDGSWARPATIRSGERWGLSLSP